MDSIEAMKETNNFVGAWMADCSGLPVFALNTKFTPKEAGLSPMLETETFLLGNHGITALVDARGRCQIHSGDRSWACLNGNRMKYLTHCRSSLSLAGQSAQDLHSLRPDSCEVGCGFATFRYVYGDVEVERVLSLMPSLYCGERRPIIFVTLRLKNNGLAAVDIKWEEAFGARYDFTALNNPGAVNKRRVAYPASCSLEGKVLTTRFTPVADMPLVLSEGLELAWQESHPPRVCLAAIEQDGQLSWSRESTDLIWMKHSLSASVPANGEATFMLALGYAQDGFDWESLVTQHPRPDGRFFRDAWRKVIPAWEGSEDKMLNLEMQWHAATLHAMATWSEWYEETFIPQGTVYEYAYGCAAVIRDHLQHALPCCHYAPDLAASILRYVGKHTDPWGFIRKGDEGARQHMMHHDQKSDSQIYAMYVLSEYLRVRKEVGVLVEPIHFLESPRQTDLLDCCARWLRFLRDEVNTGPHGFVRMGCGDWNDCFYSLLQDVAYQKIFVRCESGLNTTMAIVVLARLADALEPLVVRPELATRRRQVEDIIQVARVYRSELLEALLKVMPGRSFVTRAYLEEMVIGEDEMFFEPQPWLLGIPELADEHAKIWQAIREKVWDDEPCGARQRERPGAGENGGIWFALNGPLVDTLLGFCPAAAQEALERTTCRRRSQTYPDRWIGAWSCGDSIASHNHPDQRFAGGVVGFLHPMPVYCAHAHAWPLHGWLRIREGMSRADGNTSGNVNVGKLNYQ